MFQQFLEKPNSIFSNIEKTTHIQQRKLHSMNSTHEFADTYNKFLALSSEIKAYAIEKSEYKEVVATSTETIERRAVVVVPDGNARRSVATKIDKWEFLRDKLHEISPDRFPLNSELFNPAPTIIDNVISAQVYVNTATNSRIYPTRNIIKRLDRMRKAYINKRESSLYEAEIDQIDKELEYFNAHIDDKFRLRVSDYTEVVINLTFGSGDNKQIKVHDSGLFLVPPRGKRVNLSQPDQKPQNGIRGKRVSIYDSISPIETCLPLTGNLYLERDKVAAENEKARNEQRLAFKK